MKSNKELLKSRGKRAFALLLAAVMMFGIFVSNPIEPIMAYGEEESFYYRYMNSHTSFSQNVGKKTKYDGTVMEESDSISSGFGNYRGFLVSNPTSSTSETDGLALIKEATTFGDIEDGSWLCLFSESIRLNWGYQNDYAYLNAPENPEDLDDFTYTFDLDMTAEEYESYYGRNVFFCHRRNKNFDYQWSTPVTFTQTEEGYHLHIEGIPYDAYYCEILYAEDVPTFSISNAPYAISYAETLFDKYMNSGRILYENNGYMDGPIIQSAGDIGVGSHLDYSSQTARCILFGTDIVTGVTSYNGDVICYLTLNGSLSDYVNLSDTKYRLGLQAIPDSWYDVSSISIGEIDYDVVEEEPVFSFTSETQYEIIPGESDDYTVDHIFNYEDLSKKFEIPYSSTPVTRLFSVDGTDYDLSQAQTLFDGWAEDGIYLYETSTGSIIHTASELVKDGTYTAFPNEFTTNATWIKDDGSQDGVAVTFQIKGNISNYNNISEVKCIASFPKNNRNFQPVLAFEDNNNSHACPIYYNSDTDIYFVNEQIRYTFAKTNDFKIRRDTVNTATALGYVNVFLQDDSGDEIFYGKCGIVDVDLSNNTRKTVRAVKIDLSAMVDISKTPFFKSGNLAGRIYTDDEAYYVYKTGGSSKESNAIVCGENLTVKMLNEDEPRTLEYRYSLDTGDILSPDKTYQISFLENATTYSNPNTSPSDNYLNASDFQYHFLDGTTEQAGSVDAGSSFSSYFFEYYTIQPPKVEEGHAWRYDGDGIFTEIVAEVTEKPSTKTVEQVSIGDILTGNSDYLITYANDNDGNKIAFSLFDASGDNAPYKRQEECFNAGKIIVQSPDGTTSEYTLFAPGAYMSSFDATVESADGDNATIPVGEFLIHLGNGHNYKVVSILPKDVSASRPSNWLQYTRPIITLEEQHVFDEDTKEPAETDEFGNVIKYAIHCVEEDADEYVYMKADEVPYYSTVIRGETYDTSRIQSMMESACEQDNLLDGTITTKVTDVILRSSEDNTSWSTVNNSEFPSEGWTVKVAYPEGTSGDSHTFVLAHLLTTDEGGQQAGELEFPEITLEEDGIVFTVHSLSPIAISYAERDDSMVTGISASYTGGVKEVGSTVSKSELTVTATYSDGWTRVLADDEYTFSPATITVVGTNTITVVFSGNTALTDAVAVQGKKTANASASSAPSNSSSTSSSSTTGDSTGQTETSVDATMSVAAPQTNDTNALFCWAIVAMIAVASIAIPIASTCYRSRRKKEKD